MGTRWDPAISRSGWWRHRCDLPIGAVEGEWWDKLRRAGGSPRGEEDERADRRSIERVAAARGRRRGERQGLRSSDRRRRTRAGRRRTGRSRRYRHRPGTVRPAARGAGVLHLDDGRDVRAAQDLAARDGPGTTTALEGPRGRLRELRDEG